MNILELTDNQLSVVQRALDFYSRVGSGQFNEIKDHPTFERHLTNEFSSKEPLKVGDRTNRGVIVRITDKYIKTRGSWGNGEEVKTWTDLENVNHSTDYVMYHATRDKVDSLLVNPRNMLYNDHSIGSNGSWGIHNKNIDNSCRTAFDIIQVIRHERWKARKDSSLHTVDSSIHFSDRESDESYKIKCTLN